MKKKIVIGFIILSLIINCILPVRVIAIGNDVDSIINSMSTEEKIAQMIMPSFRWSNSTNTAKVTTITTDIENLLNHRSFAGVILFGQNIVDTEQTVRLIDSFQKANAANPNSKSQLLISVDQEGGSITRLAEATIMPGNMGIGATNDPNLAYDAGNIIGSELNALGFNVDFAPVTDVNNNPANPIIGVRSFSDDPDKVGLFASKFMKGLQNNSVSTALKHFPGHGDTSKDTHSEISIVNKSYDELKQLELKPFQKLINEGTDMVMTTHIQYPQVEQQKHISYSTGEEIYLPATLSKTMITDILRTDMGYNGVVVTDALDMKSVADHFTKYDIAKLAINAGVDILLMPVETNGTDAINELDNYITNVANMVDNNEISLTNVNAAVKRILTLKQNKGLLNEYNVDLDSKIANALKKVSTVSSHDKEFEMAKKAITLLKNDNEVLPLNAEDKTLILYCYANHDKSSDYALTKLIKDGVISSKSNIHLYDFTEDMDTIENEVKDAKNVIIINSMSGVSGYSKFTSFLSYMIDDLIELAHNNNAKAIYVSSQLPYDSARFNKADAIIATYLSTGLSFDLENYNTNKPIKMYGANLIAGIYQLFNKNANFTGRLPVNVYKLDNNYDFTNNVLYARGYGLNYRQEYKILEGENQKIEFNSKDNLVVKASGEVERLRKILVDRNELDKKYYTIKNGSTILSIKSSYLNTLSEGTHELTFVYEDGEVSTNFMIYNNKVNVPDTYDDEIYYFITGIISLLGLCSILYLRRTNN